MNLTKKSVLRGDLDKYWKRFDALTEDNMRKAIKSPDVAKAIDKLIS